MSWTDGGSGAPPFLSGFDADSEFLGSSYDAFGDSVALLSLTEGSGDAVSDSAPICFRAGTRITTFDGKELPVENIRSGMLLANAFDPSKYHRVVRLHTRTTPSIVVFNPLHFNKNQKRALYITPRHLVFITSRKKWLEAKHIRGGQTYSFADQTRVFHVETANWGAILAEGVPCETAAVTSAQKNARHAANSMAECDM